MHFVGVSINVNKYYLCPINCIFDSRLPNVTLSLKNDSFFLCDRMVFTQIVHFSLKITRKV